MSLKNRPEFETEIETEVNEAEVVVDAGKAAPAAGVAAAQAPAVRASSAVGTPRSAQFAPAFAEFNGFFDIATVDSLALATPRIKGEQGSLFRGQDELGPSVQFEIVSFNPRWVIGCGEDNDEARDLFRVSYDNKVTTNGEDVQDYIQSLKAQGYAKANIAPYLDVFGFVTKIGDKEIPVERRELSCLQCSKTSMGAFKAFCTTQGLLQSRGLSRPTSEVEVHAEKRTAGNNKYTNFSFHMPKA